MNPEWHGGATGKSRRSQSFNSARFHPRNFGTCYSNLFWRIDVGSSDKPCMQCVLC